MNSCLHILQMRTVLLVALLSIASIGACSFDRGDRYWSGRPQPIGIDFSYNSVVAVYADGVNNFTTLGFGVPKPGNNYGQYIHAAFLERSKWGEDSQIINDDDQFMYLSWHEEILSKFSSWVLSLPGRLLSKSCEELLPRVLSPNRYHYVCEAEDVPQKPRSKYGKLRSQSRQMTKLRSMMPKWFRSPQSKPFTKSDFIRSMAELLEDLKEATLRDHNIEITSATVSRPSWIFNEKSDMMDEACLLAGIELLEQPQDRDDVAAKIASPGTALIIMDHGQYHLDVVHAVWNEGENRHSMEGRVALDGHGSDSIWLWLADRLTGRYNANSTTEIVWRKTPDPTSVFHQIIDARFKIKYGGDWHQDLEFANRTIAINITDVIGSPRALNMTGQDIIDVENEYVEDLGKELRRLLYNLDAINTYRKSLPDYLESTKLPWEEQSKLLDYIVTYVTPPPEIGSWTWPVDEILILDTGYDVGILSQAAEKTIQTKNDRSSSGICVPNIEIAARGAALRAIEWGVYYDASQWSEWIWDDDSEGWVRSDDEDEENEDEEMDEMEEEL